MNYHHMKTHADAHRTTLMQDTERERLAQSAVAKQKPPLSIRIEVNFGRLAQWRLQFGTSETKVNYDPIPNCG